MKIEKRIIDTFHYNEIGNKSPLILSNSIIETINFDLLKSSCEIIIENCIVGNFSLHACWFKQGLLLKNNIFLKRIDYYMGGHNDVPISIYGNTFQEFVDFNDCIFTNKIDLQFNIFKKGTNLLGNLNDAAKNTFESEVIAKNNLGALNLDGYG